MIFFTHIEWKYAKPIEFVLFSISWTLPFNLIDDLTCFPIITMYFLFSSLRTGFYFLTDFHTLMLTFYSTTVTLTVVYCHLFHFSLSLALILPTTIFMDDRKFLYIIHRSITSLVPRPSCSHAAHSFGKVWLWYLSVFSSTFSSS